MQRELISWACLDANRAIRWLCGECLDFLWHKRNPERRAVWKAGRADRKKAAQLERENKVTITTGPAKTPYSWRTLSG